MQAPRVTLCAFLLAAVIAGVTLAATPGAAQLSDDSPLEDLLANEESDDEGFLPDVDLSDEWAAIQGGRERIQHWLAQQSPDWLLDLTGTGGSTTTAADQAANVTAFYNAHNGSFEAWVNARTTASESSDVVEITWTIEDETATRYLVANGTGSNYTNSSMKTSTNRTVDHTVTLCGLAARSTAAEIREFHDEYVEPGEDIDRDYVARRTTKYGPDVETSLLASDGSCEVGA